MGAVLILVFSLFLSFVDLCVYLASNFGGAPRRHFHTHFLCKDHFPRLAGRGCSALCPREMLSAVLPKSSLCRCRMHFLDLLTLCVKFFFPMGLITFQKEEDAARCLQQ